VWSSIAQAIQDACNTDFESATRIAVGGGSINDASILDNGEFSVFVKTNSGDYSDMFAAEAAGLQELAGADALRVPQVITQGEVGETCFLVLENLELGGRGSAQQLGEQLASLHQHTAGQYGWYRDNTIGSTPQLNGQHHEWISFYRDQRIAWQLELAQQKGYGGNLQQQGDKLLSEIDKFFTDYTPVASLLHGDLWSGNFGYTQAGEPVVYDPAVYYGDREADIAMTELFGGFSSDFYQAYQNAYPLDEGYNVRKNLYNLYHILNHLNLFGGGYLHQAESIIQRLLAEIH